MYERSYNILQPVVHSCPVKKGGLSKVVSIPIKSANKNIKTITTNIPTQVFV